ncbi:DUF87 domain-containing protein [Candidatus Woesearchaeota archaeon]|nr:DUF87 domain-containing protein [Candidatus Woesearchaeota archaeon]
MTLGIITGKSSTNHFFFSVQDLQRAKKFHYVQVLHREGYNVLAYITDVERKEQETIAQCMILGYRDEQTILRTLRIPLEPGTSVLDATDDFIRTTLGLGETKGAYFGILEGREKLPVYLDLNKLLTRHAAILAKTGSGKSYAVGVLLEEIMERNVPIVVIDPHGEYSTLKLPNLNKENFSRFHIQPKGYTSHVQEYSPDVQRNPEARPLKLSLKSLSGTELMHLLPGKLSSTQIGLLYSALMDTGSGTNFDQLLINLQLEDHPAKWTLITVIEYLKKLNLFSDAATPLSELVQPGKCTLLNLRGVPQEIQEMIVYKLVQDLFTARKNTELPPFFLVVEEAHNFCLAGDTLISTATGTKKIANIKDNDLVTTFNFESASLEYKFPSQFHVPRFAEVYEISTQFGNTLKATKDHPIFSKEGFTFVSGVTNIAIPLETSYNMEKDHVTARILGHIFGDGWLTRDGTAGFSGRSEDLLKIKEDLTSLGFLSSNIHDLSNTSEINSLDYGLLQVIGKGHSFTSSTRCFDFLMKYGLTPGRKVLNQSFVPQFILNGSKTVKAEFLAALMGSDGYKLRVHKRNPDTVRLSFSKITSLDANANYFAQQIIDLFAQFEISATLSVRSGNIRKDGFITRKYIISVSNQQDNFLKFVSCIGFRYRHEKEILCKKAFYYFTHKLSLLSSKDALREKVLALREKTGYGKIKLAKIFGLEPWLVRNWIYDLKSHSRSKSAGLSKFSFPTFDKWCGLYTSPHFIFDPVLKVKLIGAEQVFNLSLPNQNFIANNLLVHNCPERSYGEAKSSLVLRQIASEGRKFGVGLAVVSQRPARLEKNVLSQCHTQIILKVTNPNDVKAVGNSVEGMTSEVEEELRNLHIGTALVVGVVDLPLLVEVRPRKSKHGGEAVNILEAFDGIKTSETAEEKPAEPSFFPLKQNAPIATASKQEMLNILKPKVSAEDVRILCGDKLKKLQTFLVPCSMVTCKYKHLTFQLLCNLTNGHLVTNTERGTGTLFPFTIDKLSEKEQKIFGLASNLGKEFTAAEVFSKSGLTFSEVYDIIQTLIKKKHLSLQGNKFILSDSITFFSTLSDLACYEKNDFVTIPYDQKLSGKYTKDDFISVLNRFVQVEAMKDCYLVKYDVEYKK